MTRTLRLALPSALFALLIVAAHVHATKVRDGQVPKKDRALVETLLGDYRGSWEGEQSGDPSDFISHDHLGEIIARLEMDAAARLRLSFLRIAEDGGPGKELDLLGFGCNSSVGALRELEVEQLALSGAEEKLPHLSATFDFDIGRCKTRVDPSQSSNLHLELIEDPSSQEYKLQLSLLRTVRVASELYAQTPQGRVKVTPKVKEGGTLYHPKLEYCYEDFDGKEVCFEQSKERKDLLLPVPLPGHYGVFYGWNTVHRPKIERETDTVREYHRGDFSKKADE